MTNTAPKHPAGTRASTTRCHQTRKVEKARPLSTALETLEHRVAMLEYHVESIQAWLAHAGGSLTVPWWDRLVGSFANDPLFDEMVAAGQVYRRAQNARSRV
jgi:hypothetical protein